MLGVRDPLLFPLLVKAISRLTLKGVPGRDVIGSGSLPRWRINLGKKLLPLDMGEDFPLHTNRWFLNIMRRLHQGRVWIVSPVINTGEKNDLFFPNKPLPHFWMISSL